MTLTQWLLIWFYEIDIANDFDQVVKNFSEHLLIDSEEQDTVKEHCIGKRNLEQIAENTEWIDYDDYEKEEAIKAMNIPGRRGR